MSVAPKVFIHIVTYNSASYIGACLSSILSQAGFSLGDNLEVVVTDNASTDNTVAEINNSNVSGLNINTNNLGFAAAHNQGAKLFLNSGCDYLLVLNPDIKLESDFLQKITAAVIGNPRAGLVTPLLLRCDEALSPIVPSTIDAAGMVLTESLRHLDRGSGELVSDKFIKQEFVFGGTGACLLLKREAVNSLLLTAGKREMDSQLICVSLALDVDKRALLFDEAFFAYREDADLCWRAENLGIQTLYVPEARALHKRVVVPERRNTLDPKINSWSVRNRFLLQINNYRFAKRPLAFFTGIIFRNILVILGVMLREPSSIPGLLEFVKLIPRALARRKALKIKMAEQR